MKKMTAGKFKANGLAVIEEVQTTGEPVVITERGAAMVKVVPVTSEESVVWVYGRRIQNYGRH